MPPLKMYILIKDSIDLGHAMLAVGHGVLAADKAFKDDANYQEWKANSFRKVICKLNAKEFERAKTDDKTLLMHEMGIPGDNKETAVICCPRPEWPERYTWYRLYDD